MKYSVLFGLFFGAITLSIAQKEKPKNYPRYDEKILHFGFTLGGNVSNFTSYVVPDAYDKYQVIRLENVSQPGGQVGFVSSLRLGSPVFRLRTTPCISFQERLLKYTLVDPEDPEKEVFNEERVNSTNLEFPLMIQFRTLRFNNFTSYFLLGGQYSRDMQTQENAVQSFIDPFIKIRADDFQGQAGIGVEFFAPFFKCGLEIKFSQSFLNSFIQDNTPSSNPIQSLYTKTWLFSIIFEG